MNKYLMYRYTQP